MIARPSSEMFARHLARLADSRTRDRAGIRMANKRAIIPMTTSSSTSVNARGWLIALKRRRIIRIVVLQVDSDAVTLAILPRERQERSKNLRARDQGG